MAAYGGLTVLEIARDGKVAVRQVTPSSGDVAYLVAHTHIYYTGSQRDAREVLVDQNQAMQKKESVDHARVAESLHRIKELGHRILEAIENSNFDRWGELLDQHWQSKKKLSNKITWSRVNEIYDVVRYSFVILGGQCI